MVLVTCWLVWKERNNRVFNNLATQAGSLVGLIIEEGRKWIAT
jgi:hypothetical protein